MCSSDLKYLQNEKNIRFTGGSPEGFSREGLLFRIHLSSPLSDKAIISWIGGSAYLNDGKGTKEVVFAKPFTLNDVQDSENRLAGHLELNNQQLSSKASPYNVILLFIMVTFVAVFSLYAYKKFNKK